MWTDHVHTLNILVTKKEKTFIWQEYLKNKVQSQIGSNVQSHLILAVAIYTWKKNFFFLMHAVWKTSQDKNGHGQNNKVTHLPNEFSGSERSLREGTFCILQVSSTLISCLTRRGRGLARSRSGAGPSTENVWNKEKIKMTQTTRKRRLKIGVITTKGPIK